jgi:hypothetical protein
LPTIAAAHEERTILSDKCSMARRLTATRTHGDDSLADVNLTPFADIC